MISSRKTCQLSFADIFCQRLLILRIGKADKRNSQRRQLINSTSPGSNHQIRTNHQSCHIFHPAVNHHISKPFLFLQLLKMGIKLPHHQMKFYLRGIKPFQYFSRNVVHITASGGNQHLFHLFPYLILLPLKLLSQRNKAAANHKLHLPVFI